MSTFKENTLMRDPLTGLGRVYLKGETVPDSAAPAAEPAPAPSQDEEAAQQDEGFDPGAHTVAEVKEYLEAADADEFERVMAAEAADKNRKGVIDFAVDDAE